MSFSFFMVLPNARRPGSIPSLRQRSISPGLATSKLDPTSANRSRTSAAGLAFTAKRTRQAGRTVGQPPVARLDQIQVDDKKRRGQTRVLGQEPTDRLRGPGCIQPTVNICCAHTTPALSICIAPTPRHSTRRPCGEPLDTQRAPIAWPGWTEAWAPVHAEETGRRPPEIRLGAIFGPSAAPETPTLGQATDSDHDGTSRMLSVGVLSEQL